MTASLPDLSGAAFLQKLWKELCSSKMPGTLEVLYIGSESASDL
jgi:hypothetical protein